MLTSGSYCRDRTSSTSSITAIMAGVYIRHALRSLFKNNDCHKPRDPSWNIRGLTVRRRSAPLGPPSAQPSLHCMGGGIGTKVRWSRTPRASRTTDRNRWAQTHRRGRHTEAAGVTLRLPDRPLDRARALVSRFIVHDAAVFSCGARFRAWRAVARWSFVTRALTSRGGMLRGLFLRVRLRTVENGRKREFRD